MAADTEFTNIIQGLYNAKVARLPLWMDSDYWRYDQIDPWHDDAARIEEEARQGVGALRAGHCERSPAGYEIKVFTLRAEMRALRTRENRQKRRPLLQLMLAEKSVRAKQHVERVVKADRTSRFVLPIREPARKLPAPSAWATVAPFPLSQSRKEIWQSFGEALAKDAIELPASDLYSCKVSHRPLYKGEYVDQAGQRWEWSDRAWRRA